MLQANCNNQKTRFPLTNLSCLCKAIKAHHIPNLSYEIRCLQEIPSKDKDSPHQHHANTHRARQNSCRRCYHRTSLVLVSVTVNLQARYQPLATDHTELKHLTATQRRDRQGNNTAPSSHSRRGTNRSALSQRKQRWRRSSSSSTTSQ